MDGRLFFLFRSPGDVYTKALRITIVYWDAPPPSNNGKERAKNRAGSPSRKKTCKQILVVTGILETGGFCKVIFLGCVCFHFWGMIFLNIILHKVGTKIDCHQTFAVDDGKIRQLESLN